MRGLHQETFSNGIDVIVLEMRDTPVVAVQTWVGVGSADESPREAGLAHLHEHMLFKGTKHRRVGEIAQAIEAAGGDINAWTSLDHTVYHVVIASRFFEVGIEVLGDAIQHSSFDPDELDREKEVVLEEIKRSDDSPSRVVFQDAFRLAFRVHPYGRPVIGTADRVAAHTRDDVLSFYRTWYTPKNIVVVIAGDVDPRKAIREARRVFGRFRGPEPPARHGLSEPRQRRPRAAIRRGSFEETYFNLVFPAPPVEHEDVPALDVLAAILGQGESSRFSQRLKRQAGVVNDIYAYAYTPRDPGVFLFGGSSPTGATEEALRRISMELNTICEDEVSDNELGKARALLESQAVYDKETMQGMARKLGFYQSTLRDVSFEDHYYSRLAAVTPARLREIATRYLKPDTVAISVLQSAQAKQPLTATQCKELFLQPTAKRKAAVRRPRKPRKPEVVRAELPGGGTVVVRVERRVPLVAARAAWRGGLRFEKPRNNGITNLVAELITQGTERRSAGQLAEQVDALAGSLSGFMGRNSFGLRTEMLARHLDRGLELLGECILQPGFHAEELSRQRELTLEELRTLDDHPAGVAFRLFAQTLYPKHPYRLQVLGTPEVVNGLAGEDLSRFYRKHYPRDRLVLAVVGNVDPSDVIERIDRLLGAPRAGAASPPAPRPDAPPVSPVAAERILEKQQAHLVLGFAGTTVDSPDRYALEVLSTVLSGQSGRLFLELRDKQSLAYSLSSFSVEGLDPGYFAVYIGTSPEKIEQALGSIVVELERIREKTVSAVELRRAQRYLVGSHAIALQRLSTRAAMIAFDECYGLGHDHGDAYEEAILAVTPADVVDVAQRYLDLERFALSLVRPASAVGVDHLKVDGKPLRVVTSG